MPRRLLLHIGMHKTGSTAIQNAFSGYDDGTTAYLNLFQSNHSYGLTMLFCPEQASKMIERAWVRSLAELQIKASAVRHRLDEQIKRGRQTLIVSGETLSKWFDVQEVERLQAVFAPSFDEIRVIVYLREPAAFLRSSVQEMLKNQPCKLADSRFPDYRKRLSCWETVFGRDAMDYVLFAPDTLAGQDVGSDFAGRVGLMPGQVGSLRANESMSAETFAMLYRLRNGPPVSKWAWPAARMHALGNHPTRFGHRRFAIADTVWQEQIAANADCIAWAEDRMGRRFIPEPVRPDAVVFASQAEILDFAAAYETACRQWSREAVPFQRAVQLYLRSRWVRG